MKRSEYQKPEPTFYGYNIKTLAFIAGIMVQKGITAEEAIDIFRDAERLVNIIYDETEKHFRNACEEALRTQPFFGSWGIKDE